MWLPASPESSTFAKSKPKPATSPRELFQRATPDSSDIVAAERALRAVVIGRKNGLFAGSERGGHAAADFPTESQNDWVRIQHYSESDCGRWSNSGLLTTATSVMS